MTWSVRIGHSNATSVNRCGFGRGPVAVMDTAVVGTVDLE